MDAVEKMMLEEADRRKSLADRTWTWGAILGFGGLAVAGLGAVIGGAEVDGGHAIPGVLATIAIGGVGIAIHRTGNHDVKIGQQYAAEANILRNDAQSTNQE